MTGVQTCLFRSIGLALLSARFGFSAAFRNAGNGDYSGFGAQFLALALASALMLPLIGAGHGSGISTGIGIAFLTGAFLFGIGMQLAGGCASGTLYLLGGGDLRFAFALAAFVIGSAAGAAHMGFWWSLPAFSPLGVFSSSVWPVLALLQVAILLAIAVVLIRCNPPARSLIYGGIALALLNTATLLVAGRAWTETFGFALWGSKLASLIGFQPRTWTFWQAYGVEALERSIFVETTSLMDMSIIAGAMLAAFGRREFILKMPTVAGAGVATLGGLLMGYGARLSDGCNIGAYFSAVATGSLSGFVWIVPALAGSMLGVRVRQNYESRAATVIRQA